MIKPFLLRTSRAPRFVLLTALLLALVPAPAGAETTLKPGRFDARVRIVTYNADDIVRLVTHFGFSTAIHLHPEEKVKAISIGEAVAWEAKTNADTNTIFLIPKGPSETNMTIITDQRRYLFHLFSRKTLDMKEMTFTLSFFYPENFVQFFGKKKDGKKPVGSLPPAPPGEKMKAKRPSAWNFDYSFAGDTMLRPKGVFDDGEFTYFEFTGDRETPAIFLVGTDGKEALLNGKREGRYVVVHKTAARFSLRQGAYVTCIFNGGKSPPKEVARVSAEEIDGANRKESHE